jgi:hypothetical protein
MAGSRRRESQQQKDYFSKSQSSGKNKKINTPPMRLWMTIFLFVQAAQ